MPGSTGSRESWWYAGGAAAALALLVGWLLALGRPMVCACGTVRLWAPAHDSQHFADWYSLLHVTFGILQLLLIRHFQPRWTLPATALAALVGSVVWEAVENLPAVIALFNPPGAERSYAGDTVLNAVGDTLFVLAGCLLAARWSARRALVAIVAIEILVWLAIQDGLAIGAVRLLIGG